LTHTQAGEDRLRQLAAQVQHLHNEETLSTATPLDHKPWRLDALPFILPADEWQVLEQGILQRARLLDRVVEDLYGPQTLLAGGVLPPALAFANPSFLLPGCGALPARSDSRDHPSGALSLLAFDLGRSPDGRWWVLNNRTEAPTGLGYALQNRIVMARSLPGLISDLNVERLAGFYERMSGALLGRGASIGDDTGLAALLTEGPGADSYAELAYLGRYLGLPVIEGDDLTVRGGDVFLKTLEGLKPVGAVARFVRSELCDPLELKSTSLHGTPGILNAARRHRIAITNVIGSGVIENDAIMGFLPGLSERLLGETLSLPSIATWWCGQPKDRQRVLENLSELRLGSAFELQRLRDSRVHDYERQSDPQDDFAPSATSIQQQPYHYVGRETISLSTVPYLDDQQQLRSAPMTLRLYAAFTGEDFEVMPGGLARIAAANGDISKDVWVPNAAGRAAPPPRRPALTRRSDKDLPSRTGDDLFWLGRYLERTEGAIRLYRALFRALAQDAALSEGSLTLEQITALLVTLGHLSAESAQNALGEGLSGVDRQLWSLLFDDAGIEGLASLLGNVQRTAGRLRSRLSSDTWRLFERLGEFPKLRWRVDSASDLSALLEEVLERLAAVSGKTAENMTRGYGWRLLELGKRIERARFGTRLLRELAREPRQDDGGALPRLLAIADSTITHRARYRSAASALTVVDLLLVDGSNPRSIVYQINQMYPHLRVMPLEPRDEQLSESHRILLSIQNELTLANIERLIMRHNKDGRRALLEKLLKRVDQAMAALSSHISRTYFAHTRSPHR
jgi:uncharacterized circularly permuted ATP-grasp superfamily protein/uncharacterized alpha-E superfamily protein